MKKRIVTITMTLLVGGLLYFTGIKTGKAYYYGPPTGYTGSPHDGKTCDYSGCHNSYTLQSAKPWISSNVPVAGYSPDTTYTFTAKAIYVGKSSFGFEISPQNASGTKLGTLISTSSATQIAAGKYIEQTANSYQGTDSVVWTFQWKAPAAGTGSVTFYGCFNCGQGNSSAANTFVFPATLVIPENVDAGVSSLADRVASFSLFPNPAKQYIHISYSLNSTAEVEINLYSMGGQKISMLNDNVISSGAHTELLPLPATIKAGTYFIQLLANGTSTVQRLVVMD